MKKFNSFLLAILFMSLILGSCGKRYETVPGDSQHTMIYTLDNGLKVYMSVNKDQPRIQTYMAVRVGGKNDPSETTGLAHYFEHLMFKGSQQFGTSNYAAEKPLLDEIEQLFEVYRVTTDEMQRKAIYAKIDSISYEASKIAIPNEYDKLMAVIGADGTNAWTSMDETVYTEDIPSNQIENWAKIQADRFKNVTIRGFHTELETIYEEKNMSLTQDSRKAREALNAALFTHHPYGQQTVLGSQEHLKNPSITNVKRYHDQYYVPNNIAVCLSGDFDPDEMIAIIEKYFGDWAPNPNIPVLDFEPETPITKPIEKEVFGLESESITMGWRLPSVRDLKTSAIADVTGAILNNGTAGIIDINVVQAQRALSMAAGYLPQPDYSSFLVMGYPKQSQSLEELRDIALEQIDILKKGEFDESLISSTINNFKLSYMSALESNEARAQRYVDAFINGIDWKDAVKDLERCEAVTKEDIVAFANQYLGSDSYVVVYKRQGEDNTVQKIAAPTITPIVTNRDNQSAFLTEIANSQVKPIEPVFVDFDKDMSIAKLNDGVELLYKKNETNDIFQLTMRFNRGLIDDPALDLATSYIQYLGTDKMTAEELATKMYALACNYSARVSANVTTVNISGLSENMEEALTLFEDFVANAQPDEDILVNVKSDELVSHIRAKASQSSCYNALSRYAIYGADYVKNTNLDDMEIMALTSEDLLSKVRELFSFGHDVLYYGPMSETSVKDVLLRSHNMNGAGMMLEEKNVPIQQTPESSVLMAQYDAKQIYYVQYSNRGETYNPANVAEIALYNEYFGGGMNSIVFQEMREARGLAYSARGTLSIPSFPDGNFYFQAFIATQNDKMRQAIEAFDDIINNMPQSEAAFAVAKDAMISRLRTQRTLGMDVLSSYLSCRRLGLTEPIDRQVYEKVLNMTMADVVATQQKWVKDRKYTYMILGDIKDLDTDFLSSLGPVKIVSLEDIFGF